MAAAAATLPLLLPEASKLASSVTAHIASALGTPLLKSETVKYRVTKHGSTIRTTSSAIPAWAAIAAGGLFLLSIRPGGGTAPTGGNWLLQLFSGLFPIAGPIIAPIIGGAPAPIILPPPGLKATSGRQLLVTR